MQDNSVHKVHWREDLLYDKDSTRLHHSHRKATSFKNIQNTSNILKHLLGLFRICNNEAEVLKFRLCQCVTDQNLQKGGHICLTCLLQSTRSCALEVQIYFQVPSSPLPTPRRWEWSLQTEVQWVFDGSLLQSATVSGQ